MFFFSENVAKNDDLARALTEYPRKIQNSGVIKTRVKRGVLEDENISFLNFSDGPRRPEYYVTSRLFTFGKKNFVPSFFSLLSFFWHLGRPNRAEDLCMENEKRSCDPRNPVIYRPLSIPFFSFYFCFRETAPQSLSKPCVFTPTSTYMHIISSLLCLRQTANDVAGVQQKHWDKSFSILKVFV